MKCHRCNEETNGWCFECETHSMCYQQFGKQRCLREADHDGPCSPMHFKVFSIDMQLANAFEEMKVMYNMRMYSIAELGDGTYQRRCRIQDGVEVAKNATKEDAVRDLIRDAKFLNWVEITEEDIHFEYHIPHARAGVSQMPRKGKG